MKSKKILIVDDDMTALDLIDIFFERHGFEVVRQTDGAWVVDNIEQIAPDVILIDVMMPKMSGDECIERIRGMGKTMPIVAFTAANDAEMHTELMSKGADLVLTKPCKPDVLINKVTRLLDRND